MAVLYKMTKCMSLVLIVLTHVFFTNSVFAEDRKSAYYS